MGRQSWQKGWDLAAALTLLPTVLTLRPPMNRALLMALCACAAAHCVATGDELSLGPREGVLLLHNGELLAGTIIAAGDRYDVHLENGEISVKRSDVALVCRDAAECYRHKRAGIEAGRVQDHLELAEWCIKNGLTESAEKELAAARAADAAHPRIRLVESRLALAKEPPKSEPAAAPKKPAAQVALDRMARNLPGGTMEAFTDTIQPMLLNYCAGSGCHSARAAGGFKLERIHPKRSGRFTTQRNLQRVLLQVDHENPPQSKLLLAPIRPHGTAKSPVFTNREQSQYKLLVLWVYAVAGGRKTAARPTLAERTAPLLQAVPGASGPQSPESVEPPHERDGSRIPPSSADQAFTRDELRAMGILPHAWSNVQYGAEAAPDFVPTDPFDPEIFNRRFFGR